MTVYGVEVTRFVARPGVDFGEHQAIGWRGRDGRIVAGVVFHDWNPAKEAIEISLAGNCTWRHVHEVFNYAFGFCRLVHGKTESAAVRRAMRRLGGFECEIPGLFTMVWLTREQYWRNRP